jgi:hypothetical protein
MNRQELAGKFMQLQQNELFNEFQEGLMTGIPAGLSLIGTDVSLPQVALQTVGAVAGGFGLGMLGKTIGARIGKHLHPQALKNQEGLAGSFGRIAGQKTLTQGAAETMRHAKGQIKQELKQQTSSQLLNEALQSPQTFASKYGVDPETFKKYHSAVGQAGQARAVLETVENLSPEQRKQMGAAAQTLMDKGFNQVENLINVQAAASMDNNIAKMASRQKGKTIPGTDMDMGEVFESLLKQPNAVTGEHVGRAVGRLIGDEVGVVTGIGLTGALAGSLGMKTEKDKKIEELQQQVGRRY